jgi:PAS domain-containing protein
MSVMESSRADGRVDAAGNAQPGAAHPQAAGAAPAGAVVPQTATFDSAPALADSEKRFQLLVEAVTDYAIYMLDPQGRVVTWNAGAERNKGYRAEEVLGRNFSLFFLPEDAAAGLPQRELAAAASEGR